MADHSDHLDRLLAALPFRVFAPPRPSAPRSFPVWRWPLPRTYNGFTGVERVRGWQVSRFLETAGSLPRPTSCDICSGSERIAYHSEGYYHIGRAPTLCRSCHRAAHRRAQDWEHWSELVDRHSTNADQWFRLLSRKPVDLAGHIRRTWGWEAADLLKSPLLSPDDPIREALPGNLVPHPMVKPLLLCRSHRQR